MARTQTERKNEWNSRNYERITVMVKAGLIEDARTMAGLSPVARIERPRRVPMNQ